MSLKNITREIFISFLKRMVHTLHKNIVKHCQRVLKVWSTSSEIATLTRHVNHAPLQGHKAHFNSFSVSSLVKVTHRAFKFSEAHGQGSMCFWFVKICLSYGKYITTNYYSFMQNSNFFRQTFS